MPSSDIARGNVLYSTLLGITLSPASVANATSAEQTFPVPGLLMTDLVFIEKPTAQAGLGIVGTRVSAANVLAVTFMNATAATITPTASELYTLLVTRPSNPGQALPTALV